MKPILEAVVELHEALDAAAIPHAFGGAFALLWCTGEPRTTVDIDVNVFIDPVETPRMLAALPPGIGHTESDAKILRSEGQHRLYFDGIPVDLFLDTTRFHDDVKLRTTVHELAERQLPFLGCTDLAVFKAFFNRRKDWADIEEMIRSDRIDSAYVIGVLTTYLGEGDERIRQLDDIRREVSEQIER